MNNFVTFREYKKEEASMIEDLIRRTWQYDELTDAKTAKKLARVFLASCLANQTFTQVALLDNQPCGIIMAKTLENFHCPFKYQYHQLIAIVQLLITKEGRAVSHLFRNVHRIDQTLLKQSQCPYQAELSFFAVDETARGLGIGKALFQQAMDYLRQQHIHDFYLFTDTSCNYGFYEHQGMVRRTQQSLSYAMGGNAQKMDFFLYDGKLK